MRDLKADMETCKNATPGPWMASIDHEVEDYRVCQDNGDGECICCLAMMGNWDQETQEWTGESKTSFAADTRFIAAAREGWPHAIERAIAAESENKAKWMREVHQHCDWEIKRLEAENARLQAALRLASEQALTCYGGYCPADVANWPPNNDYCANCDEKDWQDCWYDYYLAISKTETTTKDWP